MKHILALFTIILAILAVYVPSLQNDFVWDDHHLVRNADYIREFDLGNLPRIFTHSIDELYRPVRTLYYTLLYQFDGAEPFVYHLGQLFVHILTCAAFYRLLSVVVSPLLALAGALLFTLHPANVEAVAVIGNMADPLAGLFFCLALLSYALYLKHPQALWYLLSLSAYALALFSKEPTVVLPAVIILLEWRKASVLQKTNANPEKQKFSHIIIRVLPFLILTTIYLGLRFGIVESQTQIAAKGLSTFDYHQQPIGRRILSHGPINWFYWELLVAPFRLSPDYIPNPYFVLNAVNVALFLLLIGTVALAVWLLRWRQPAGFWLAAYFFTVLPTGNIFPLPNLVAERYFYLNGQMLIAFVIVLLYSALQRIGRREQYAATAVLLLVAFGFGYLSRERAQVWRNELSIFTDTVKKAPKSVRARHNLALVYLNEGFLEDAEREFRAAIRLNPDLAGNYLHLGMVYLQQGRYTEAEKAFLKALEKQPDLFKARLNCGNIAYQRGDYNLAINHYLKATESNLEAAEPFYMLGVIYGEHLDEPEKAVRYYRLSLEKSFEESRLNNPDFNETRLRGWINDQLKALGEN